MMMLSSRHALFGDPRALTHDGLIYCTGWGFDLSKIAVPIHFWHGDADANIPLQLAQKTAEAVPGAKFTIMPNDGHFSLPLLRTERILREVVT
jgi:pimeloyl-ACP methyl ester carboxylesterase